MSTLEYTGVRTTGIYCRPGCGGRPNAENTTAYRSAAAAEAAMRGDHLPMTAYVINELLTRAKQAKR